MRMGALRWRDLVGRIRSKSRSEDRAGHKVVVVFAVVALVVDAPQPLEQSCRDSKIWHRLYDSRYICTFHH